MKCCFTSTGNRRLIRDRDREPGTVTSTFTQLLCSATGMVGSVLLYVHRNRRLIIRDREPRTVTSTFTQLLCSVVTPLKGHFLSTDAVSALRKVWVLICGSNLDFHTAPVL